MTISYRIGFDGSHSVGRTTLIEALAPIVDMPVLPELARIVAARWGLTPATMPEHMLWEYQEQLLNQQIEAENDFRDIGFLGDRTVAGPLTYAGALGLLTPKNVQDLLWPRHHEQARIDAYFDRVAQHVLSYDLIVYVPVTFPPVDDGVRHTDPAFQQYVDLCWHRTVKFLDGRLDGQLRPKLYGLRATTVESRVAEMLSVIDRMQERDARRSKK